MSTETAALSSSLRIVIIGTRNSGKSSLINNLFQRDVAIVSETPGTTTDPVTRKIELGSLGPAAVTDTAGLDDEGELGAARMKKAEAVINAADLYIFTTPGDRALTGAEKRILEKSRNNRPVLWAVTFGDRPVHPQKARLLEETEHVLINNLTGEGVNTLRQKIIGKKGLLAQEPSVLEGIVTQGETALLVTPIDSAAPKGRLILPQVQTIRDLLDKECGALVVKEHEIRRFYSMLAVRPKVVITDSQAFHKAAAQIPGDQMLTSFSILFARIKGDLDEFIQGITAMKLLGKAPNILVAESCSHHRQEEDIGTVKIPRLFRQFVDPEAEFTFTRSLPAPQELAAYDMVIHCAGCMINRNKMLSKIEAVKAEEIPVTNYGLFLAWVNGLLPRALEPFPQLYEKYKDAF